MQGVVRGGDGDGCVCARRRVHSFLVQLLEVQLLLFANERSDEIVPRLFVLGELEPFKPWWRSAPPPCLPTSGEHSAT